MTPNCTCGPKRIDGKVVLTICEYHRQIGLQGVAAARKKLEEARALHGEARPVRETGPGLDAPDTEAEGTR